MRIFGGSFVVNILVPVCINMCRSFLRKLYASLILGIVQLVSRVFRLSLSHSFHYSIASSDFSVFKLLNFSNLIKSK
jgi:hypothetical protein